ncbi:hypothetical protein OC846_001018 [Tilletia horrida]|uniref:PX domain-containing protein n=1 Tax=Tilletia horrida TaxID=155126 RepID=A0AAN6GX06_9BASI|nr:hypothetical protein OC846_001018 [Tilletia horrida]
MSAGPPIQSISIPRSEARSQPAPPHRVYAIVVSLPVRSWTVYRRYSEFLALHNAFLANNDHASTPPPPAPLPPKHAARHAFKTISTLGGWLGGTSEAGSSSSGGSMSEKEPLEQRERRLGLETYLRAIIASTDPHWRTRNEFLDFLELPRSSVSNNTGSGGAAATAAAEKHRLNRDSARAAPTRAAAREPLSSPSTTYPGVAMPGAAPPPPLSSSSSASASASAGGGGGTSAMITRQLGPAPPRPDAQPGEHLAHQQALLDAQDASLQDLTSIIRRQRAVGLAINQELAEQNELLGALDDELENTGSKMKHAEGKMEQLEGKKKK